MNDEELEKRGWSKQGNCLVLWTHPAFTYEFNGRIYQRTFDKTRVEEMEEANDRIQGDTSSHK